MNFPTKQTLKRYIKSGCKRLKIWIDLLVGSGEESDQARKSSSVKDGTDASIYAAGEASERGGRLDNEVGVGVSERGSNCRDGAELDVGELLCSVSNYVVLHLADGSEFHRAIGGGEAVEDRIGGRQALGRRSVRRWHGCGGGRRRRRRWRWRKLVQDGGDANLQNDGKEKKSKSDGKRAFCFSLFFFFFLFYFIFII